MLNNTVEIKYKDVMLYLTRYLLCCCSYCCCHHCCLHWSWWLVASSYTGYLHALDITKFNYSFMFGIFFYSHPDFNILKTYFVIS